jgi:hypothetical protein
MGHPPWITSSVVQKPGCPRPLTHDIAVSLMCHPSEINYLTVMERTPDMYLHELQHALWETRDVDVSVTTIYGTLYRYGYSRKMLLGCLFSLQLTPTTCRFQDQLRDATRNSVTYIKYITYIAENLHLSSLYYVLAMNWFNVDELDSHCIVTSLRLKSDSASKRSYKCLVGVSRRCTSSTRDSGYFHLLYRCG